MRMRHTQRQIFPEALLRSCNSRYPAGFSTVLIDRAFTGPAKMLQNTCKNGCRLLGYAVSWVMSMRAITPAIFGSVSAPRNKVASCVAVGRANRHTKVKFDRRSRHEGPLSVLLTLRQGDQLLTVPGPGFQCASLSCSLALRGRARSLPDGQGSSKRILNPPRPSCTTET
jgi:hypothetical protein